MSDGVEADPALYRVAEIAGRADHLEDLTVPASGQGIHNQPLPVHCTPIAL